MARERDHAYATSVAWCGPAAGATTTYAAYSREHTIAFAGGATLRGSADAAFRGDAALPNPEALLLAALSSCHLLAYLALCARNGIDVRSYTDDARGTMRERDGVGRFVAVTLAPRVVIAREHDKENAYALHARAHAECFIANSVAFPVACEPVVAVAPA